MSDMKETLQPLIPSQSPNGEYSLKLGSLTIAKGWNNVVNLLGHHHEGILLPQLRYATRPCDNFQKD